MLTIGAVATDTSRRLRAKLAFSAIVIALVIYAIPLVALSPGRSVMELILDAYVVLACGLSAFILHITKRLDAAFSTLFYLSLLGLAAFYFLHGNRDGDFYFFILIPIAAIVFLGASRSRFYCLIAVLTGLAVLLIDPFLPHWQHAWHSSPANPQGWLFHSPDKQRLSSIQAFTLLSVLVINYGISYNGASAFTLANQQIESLLLNVLPKPIAKRLMLEREKGHDHLSIVDSFDEASILFADIVGFTTLSQQLPPGELVRLLNDLFSRFDRICLEHHVEKIKTIGDAYMAVCGLPETDRHHVHRIADTALAILVEMNDFNAKTGQQIGIRIGINTGPVVAGVIGRDKFIYDLWGDAVNTASRMESNGQAGMIQATRAVFERLNKEYHFTSLGEINIKGKGLMPTWQLTGRANTG